MTGHSEAVQFLLELVKNAPASESQLAAKSLQDLRPDSQTQEKIADALSQRTSR